MTMNERMEEVRGLLESIREDAGKAMGIIADEYEMLHFEILLGRIDDDAKTLIMMIDHRRQRDESA